MKKLFLIIGIFTILACSSNDDEAINNNITGIWEKTYPVNAADFESLDDTKNYEYVIQYLFLGSEEFESYTLIRNTETSEIAGYLFQEIGTYSLSSERLSLQSNRWIPEDGMVEPESLDDLILNEQDVEWSFNIQVEEDQLKFIFDPCGPNESCLGSLLLTRVK